MKIITCAARKGGVGKTLLTASFAVLAHRQCVERVEEVEESAPSVVLVDLDPQGCLTDWHNRRTVSGPAIAEVRPRDFVTHLDELRAAGTHYVFIDTPPGQNELRMLGIAYSDLTIIPSRPGELDLSATLRTVASATNAYARCVVLPNGANFRSRMMGEAIRNLRDAGVDMLPPIHNRVALALRGGRTATETDPSSRAADELVAAWRAADELAGRNRA